MTTCSVTTCERPTIAKTLCQSHYNSQRLTRQRAERRTERACPHCGESFTPRNVDTVYCSRRCIDRARTARGQAERLELNADRTCDRCGTLIDPSKLASARFCSTACQIADRNENQSRLKREAKLAEPRVCLRCGEAIPDVKRSNAQYCSRTCMAAASSKRRNMDGRSRTYALRYSYGISREQYEAMLTAQGNRCAICQSDAAGGKGDWHVDHCHDSGRVRGLLCNECNVGLGKFGDDPARLRAAIDYLEAVSSV